MGRSVRRLVAAVALALIVTQLAVVTGLLPGHNVRATTPAAAAFEPVWARTDRPVLQGQVARTWMWGPEPFTIPLDEAYAEAPGDQRMVQYFDKSRMELTDPVGDPTSAWYVTNGLLVVELVTGRLQLGDDTFEPRTPAQIPIAGDPDDPGGPTYATIAAVRADPPLAAGAPIVTRLARDGSLREDAALAGYGASAAELVEVPGLRHRVASPFWEFMRSGGIVEVGGQVVSDALFPNPFYATGYPIAEAHWATVLVGGAPRDVLLQCFERRCLTWTPLNPGGWQVEAGNVGRHYHAWRYGTAAPTPTPTPTSTLAATATATASVSVTSTSTATSASPTSTATSGTNPTPTPTKDHGVDPTATRQATKTPTPSPTPSPTPPQPHCLSALEADLFRLINAYRADEGLAPLSNSVRLNRAAEAFALDMTTREYFPADHQTKPPYPPDVSGPAPRDRVLHQGYSGFTSLAENIAYGYAGAVAVLEAWKDSPGHNAILLRADLTQIGIGYADVPSSDIRHAWVIDLANGNDTSAC